MSIPALRPPANRVARRAIALWMVRGAAVAAVLIGVSATVSSALAALPAARHQVSPGSLPAGLLDWADRLPAVVAAVALPLVLGVPVWRYAVERFEVLADVVYTRTGWLSRTWQLVPVARVQTVDTSQGWLERAFGLATLRVQTASHAGSSRIAGLPLPLARALAADLGRRAGELRDDAT